VIECLAELAADPEGVVREKVPSPEGGEPVTAVCLVPFHRAELSLAGQVRRLLKTGEELLRLTTQDTVLETPSPSDRP
ncbi:hypothetical protein, partial [Streptomyces sp. NPDC051657]|uniref:hypothetical protein n=1 Tax=unclassified Streptomyces TaxID=2593676 RepID=UPI003424F721